MHEHYGNIMPPATTLAEAKKYLTMIRNCKSAHANTDPVVLVDRLRQA